MNESLFTLILSVAMLGIVFTIAFLVAGKDETPDDEVTDIG